jgi:hypothetical protein
MNTLYSNTDEIAHKRSAHLTRDQRGCNSDIKASRLIFTGHRGCIRLRRSYHMV